MVFSGMVITVVLLRDLTQAHAHRARKGLVRDIDKQSNTCPVTYVARVSVSVVAIEERLSFLDKFT